MGLNTGDRLGPGLFPDANAPIGVAAGQEVSIWTPDECGYRVRLRERLKTRATVEIPEMNGRILSPTGGQEPSIGSKGGAGKIARPPVGPEQGTAGNIPELDRVIPASRDQAVSIWAERERANSVHMGPPHPVQDLALLIPYPCIPTFAARSPILPVATYRNG